MGTCPRCRSLHTAVGRAESAAVHRERMEAYQTGRPARIYRDGQGRLVAGYHTIGAEPADAGADGLDESNQPKGTPQEDDVPISSPVELPANYGCTDGNSATGWGHLNRVKLYRGKENQWTIAISVKDEGTTAAKMKAAALSLMVQWFNPNYWGRYFSDLIPQWVMPVSVTRVEVLEVSNEDPYDKFATPLVDESGSHNRMDEWWMMTPPPFLRHGRVAYVSVRFDYWGLVEWLPWPTWHDEKLGFWGDNPDRFCPFNCSAMLLRTTGYEKSLATAKTAEPKRPELTRTLGEDLEKAIRLGAYATVGVVGLLVVYKTAQVLK